MQPTDKPNRDRPEPRSFEDRVGAVVAFAGAFFVVASVVLSSTTMSACGPCWPGPCKDAQPTTSATPTPTPTATPTGDPTATPVVDCEITRDPDLIPEDLWQVDSDECPQILLDPAGPKYSAGSDLCEAGLRMDGATDQFLYRFSCNLGEPWELSIVAAGEDGTMVLEHVCPDEVPRSDTFIEGVALEATLFERNTEDIAAQADDWEAGCEAEDATEERLEQCAEVCAGEQTLYGALDELGELPEDPGVRCYLKIYDTPDRPVGTVVASADDSIALDSECGCAPTTAFLDCVVDGDDGSEPCFDEAGDYDVQCGQECWRDHGTDAELCSTG